LTTRCGGTAFIELTNGSSTPRSPRQPAAAVGSRWVGSLPKTEL